MRVENKKTVKVDELTPLIPIKQGATYSQLWQIFYYTRLLKYVHYRNYVQIKKAFNKICTYKKLQLLCDMGYLISPKHEVYCATNKVLPILKEVGYCTETLPPAPVGKGDINELSNTEAFIKIMSMPMFHTLLYPNFSYLIPDALLVEKNEKAYKLTFLEVETKKPQWEKWINDKIKNYMKLAKDIKFYEYWHSQCKLLKLSEPDISTLKFSVLIMGNYHKELGHGFSVLH